MEKLKGVGRWLIIITLPYAELRRRVQAGRVIGTVRYLLQENENLKKAYGFSIDR